MLILKRKGNIGDIVTYSYLHSQQLNNITVANAQVEWFPCFSQLHMWHSAKIFEFDIIVKVYFTILCLLYDTDGVAHVSTSQFY